MAHLGGAKHRDGQPGFLNRQVDARQRTRQATLLTSIVAAHVMLAGWILSSNRELPARPGVESLAMVDLSNDESEPDAPAKPATVPPVPESRAAVLLAPTSLLAAAPSTAGGGDGTGCSVTNVISAALQADNAAMAELAALPAGVRSDADAVMLWNGAWLDVAPETQSLMAENQIPALKNAVTLAVQALPPACAQVESVGPQLIPIPELGRTTMVVIGSGVWRWAALIEPPIDAAVPQPVGQTASDWLASWGISGN